MAGDDLHLAHAEGLGQPALAVQAYEMSLRLDDRNADGWINLGVARQAVGDFNRAIEAYDSGLRIRPDDPVALYNLALAHLAAGNTEEAFLAAERLRTLNPVRAMDVIAKIRRAAPGAGRPPS